MFKFFNGDKKVTEKLYGQNLELAVKNKTLSLLEKLYQTSVLNLTPEEVATQITNIIRQDLNLEIAGVLVFKKEDDSLVPLVFSKSERLTKTLTRLGFLLHDIIIKDVSKRDFFKKVVYGQEHNITNNFKEVWQDLISPEHLREIEKQSRMKTVLLYPLVAGRETFGALMLGLNRDYQVLNTFEKSSIGSFINVIALLLNKAYLYKDLQDSFEVTKRAYIAEKKAKEELEKLDTIKNQFLAQAQHDLRTPLGIIRDYCDLLFTGTFGKQTKKSRDVIERIQVVAQNKIKDVNNFLDTAQFKLGKKVVVLAPGVQLNPVLDEIMEDLKHGAKAKGIYLKFQKPEKMITIEADREKLKSAIFNIVDNSIKYTLEGGVEVKVESHGVLKISVADTGIGIAKEKMPTLFETAFERSEDARKASPTGRGIGLYLASKIVQAHNGKVWVESEGPGKGSVFHIELPLGRGTAQ